MGWEPSNQQMFVSLMDGTMVTLLTHPGWKVAGVMSILELLRRGGPPCSQRLIHGGRQLLPDQTLQEAGVQREAMLYLVGRLRGD